MLRLWSNRLRKNFYDEWLTNTDSIITFWADKEKLQYYSLLLLNLWRQMPWFAQLKNCIEYSLRQIRNHSDSRIDGKKCNFSKRTSDNHGPSQQQSYNPCHRCQRYIIKITFHLPSLCPQRKPIKWRKTCLGWFGRQLKSSRHTEQQQATKTWRSLN